MKGWQVNWEALSLGMLFWTGFGFIPVTLASHHGHVAVWALAVWLAPAALALTGLSVYSLANWLKGSNGWLIRRREPEQ